MTDKEKAKRYDEAIKKAESLYKTAEPMSGCNVLLETVFPELKESEDERIREALLEMVHDTTGDELWVDYNVHKEEALAWLEKQGKNNMGISEATKQKLEDNLNKALEKETPESWNKFLDEQGEQKHIDKIQLGKKYKCIASPRYSTFMIGNIYKPEDKFLCSLMNFCSDCFESIEDGEQKPTDKVEPKFHKGEWLCENEPNNYARFIQILETVNVQGKERYRISRDIHNDEDVVEFGFVEKYYHNFDIQDVKTGDVLHCWIDGYEFILIFNCIKDGYVNAFCHLYNNLDSFSEEPTTMFCRTIQGHFTPATKEQHDQLERAMTNAGYKWNKEELKLEKI